jgi:pimeloyl-ACP methyl ester carboxylesterase
VRTRFEVDVRDVAPSGASVVVGDLHLPEPADASGGRPPVLACCLPGGGMSRRWFDLDVPEHLGNHSMARHLARAGYVVVTIDHPGVGESDAPDDAWSLTPQVIADVDAHVVEQVRKRLSSGTLVDGVAPIDVAATVGVGHSAGAIVTVHLQARHAPYDALVLLGFGGRGWREQLDEAELAVADDPDAIRDAIVSLAQARFGEPLPMPKRGSSSLLVVSPMAPEVHAALVDARSNMLAVLGLSSMIPGSLRPDVGRVDVPVFVGLGEHDIAGAPHAVPGSFTGCRDITVFVLPGAGHNSNVHPDREVLWDRVVRWLRTVTPAPSPPASPPALPPAPPPATRRSR